jgi:hypothetical protein
MAARRNEQAVARAKELFQSNNDKEISVILRRERLLQPSGKACSAAWVAWCRKGFPRFQKVTAKQQTLPLPEMNVRGDVERIFTETVLRVGSASKARRVFEACLNLCG